MTNQIELKIHDHALDQHETITIALPPPLMVFMEIFASERDMTVQEFAEMLMAPYLEIGKN